MSRQQTSADKCLTCDLAECLLDTTDGCHIIAGELSRELSKPRYIVVEELARFIRSPHGYKAKNSARQRAYQKRNPERLAALSRIKHRRDRIKILFRFREYCKNRREQFRQYYNQRYRDNVEYRERKKQRSAAYREKHRAEINERNRLKRATDSAWREKRLEQRRPRWRSDPAYRDKVSAASRSYKANLSAEKKAAYNARRNERRRQRYAEDAAHRQRLRDYYRRKFKERYHSDTSFRQRHLAQGKAWANKKQNAGRKA